MLLHRFRIEEFGRTIAALEIYLSADQDLLVVYA